MDKENLIRIIYKLEQVLEELKSEVHSNVNVEYEETYLPVEDYDEIFEESD